MQKLFPHQLRDYFKIDLHRHLDCSVRWSTLIELAPQVGIELPIDSRARREAFLINKPMSNLGEVLKKFLNAQKVLASEEILTRIAYEVCEDAYNDGVRLLELRYAPSFINDGRQNLSFEAIHRSILKGIKLAETNFEMGIGLICIIQRTKPLELASQIVDFAIDHKDSFVGLDLADDEMAINPKAFSSIFQKAKKEGLRVTVHSGESPGTASWVKESIDCLGAERIGHGVQIINDLNILNYVRDQRIPLEVCPLSNWLTQAFPSIESHPIRQLMNAGILVTINSDDPGIFGSTLTDEYQILANEHGFTMDDFKRCNQVSFEASFIKNKNLFRHLYI